MRPGYQLLSLAPLLLLAGCADEPTGSPDHGLQRELEIRTEVLHQTREVLRYTDQTERLRRARIEEIEAHEPTWTNPSTEPARMPSAEDAEQ